MINALVVEDDLVQRTEVISILQNAFPEIRFYAASDFSDALKLLQEISFRFFLLDINLGGEQDGIQLGIRIKEQEFYASSPIIYITAVTSRMADAINKVHCYGYITKPYNPDELVSTVKCLLSLPAFAPDGLRLQSINGIYYRVRYDDIYYFESNGHVLKCHTSHGKYSTRNYSIKDLVKVLPEAFIQCHRSYVVNIGHITGYDRTKFTVKIAEPPNASVPVGRVYKKILEERLEIK